MSSLLAVPSVDIQFVPVKAGEVLKLGPITCRIIEDGSNTGMTTIWSTQMTSFTH
jgi:hypothetical protein